MAVLGPGRASDIEDDPSRIDAPSPTNLSQGCVIGVLSTWSYSISGMEANPSSLSIRDRSKTSPTLV